jgi:GT2 family glycosyltransferase
MLENPNRRTPNALNIAIAQSKGDVIVRLDAHAEYDVHYLKKCVEYLEKYSADNVGGVLKIEPQENTVIGEAIAYSFSSPFTAGNALYRVGVSSPKWVDTVFGGCYRKDVFARIGQFDERLVRGQDREFNQRLRDAGGKILLAPDIQCTYYAQSKLGEYARRTFLSGMCVFYGARVTGRRLPAVRNFVPITFVATLLALFGVSWFVPAGWLLFRGIISVYGLTSLASALPLARKEKDLRYLVVGPLVFAVTHVVYALGSVYGLVKPVRKGRNRAAAPSPDKPL